MATTDEIAILDTNSDDFAGWEGAAEPSIVDEILEEFLADKRAWELEGEPEQDENPRDYNEELENEEETAPTSKKRLKRQIQAEALTRLEEAARTENDFRYIIGEWNRLDRNRERRERDHENLRGNMPLEFMAVPNPQIIPPWMNLPNFRQISKGDFLDIIFSCPYEIYEMTANRFISEMLFHLSDEHKELLYYLSLKQYSTSRLAAIRAQTDRNIRKVRTTIYKNLQTKMYKHLRSKEKHGNSLSLRERRFLEEYDVLQKMQSKTTVIRRESKTKPRKRKAVLDENKGDQ